MNYEKAYKKLFNAITDALSELCKYNLMGIELNNAMEILKEAQCKTEEIYLTALT